MLLSLWPLFIAMPETANYALLDQQKRDERRLAKKRKQVAEELEETFRKRNGTIAENDNAGLDRAERASIEPAGIELSGFLGHDGELSVSGDTGANGISNAENGTISSGIDNAMKREDEAFFLMLVSL